MSSAPKMPVDISRLEAKPEFVDFTPRLAGAWESTDAPDPENLRYERRLASRQPVNALARMAIRGETGTQVLPVRLVDAAIGGGVRVDAPIGLNIGLRVTVYRDSQGWPPQTGTVVRCEPIGGRLSQVGLRMDGWRRA